MKTLEHTKAAPKSSVMFPAVPANVTAPTVTPLLVNVTVPVPEFPSNCGVSPAIGTDAPPAPPDVADQFAVLVLSQLPVPPTQYLFAIRSPHQAVEQ